MSDREPRNPFYFLLLLAGLVFVVNALAVAVVPVVMAKAEQAGGDVPPAGLHQLVARRGHWWLLYEAGAIAVLSVLSMGLDRLRTLKKERAPGTIPPSPPTPPREASEPWPAPQSAPRNSAG